MQTPTNIAPMPMVPLGAAIRGAFKGPGAYAWQLRWRNLLHLYPTFTAWKDTADYGMPEYAALYPTWHVNIFTFSIFQARWYSNYSG